RKTRLDALERRFPPERDGGHDHAGRTDAALRAAVLHERRLQRMTSAETFDRRHRRPIGVDGGNEAGIHRRAVDEHSAGAALAFAAALLRSGQAAVLAQRVEQALHGMNRQARALAVQDQLHAFMIFSGVAGISRRSTPACRSALMTAGAGPSMGISP